VVQRKVREALAFLVAYVLAFCYVCKLVGVSVRIGMKKNRGVGNWSGLGKNPDNFYRCVAASASKVVAVSVKKILLGERLSS
jgi:hypothetical protein